MSNDNSIMTEEHARGAFRRYVQRVAFNMTLTAPMIAALCYVRDDAGWTNDHEAGQKKFKERQEIRSTNGYQQCLFITEMKALERRGLTYYTDFPPGKMWLEGWKTRHLTRIGELTCELLVEAGLMPPIRKQNKRKRLA